MSIAKRLVTTAAGILLVVSIVRAQEQNVASSSRSAITVTAAATADRVRFAAPSTVVQMRLEVYDAKGKKLFDNEIRGGNVIDWHLQDGQAEGVSDGSYLCVITSKGLSGRMSQKLGKITIENAAASVQPTDTTQLTAQQTQAVGPLEENASLTVLKEGETQTTTVIAHNGEEGQIIRGRGALSFRLGDFYSGKDREQMRLTEEGNFGIGITHPQARLDVDGLIRTSDGIVFPDGTIQTTAANSPSGGQTPAKDREVRKLLKSTSQGTSSEKDGTGKNKVSPEFAVNEDLTINGNIIFTPGGARDITMQNNNTGLRFFGAPTLTNSPAAAAIQFWGNKSGFPGQAYIDSGAHDSAAVIIRTTGTGGTIAERMRVTATGNVGIGTTSPATMLDVAGAINTSTQYNINGSRVLSTPGSFNTFVGVNAGAVNMGTGNAFFGNGAGAANTMGDGNAFFGDGAGQVNNGGSSNAFFGSGAGLRNTMGFSNAFFGDDAGLFNTMGHSNAFFGTSAGGANNEGSFNTFFGHIAGSSNTIGSSNTTIGFFSDVGSNNLSNATAIGANAQVAQSNSLVLGSISGVNHASANVNVGIGTTMPAKRLVVGGGPGSSGIVNDGIFVNIPGGAAVTARDSSTGVEVEMNAEGTPIGTLGTSSNHALNFRTNNVERVRIDTSGNVGVGTSTPTTFKLQVAGAVGPDSDNTASLGDGSHRWTAVFATNGTIQTSDARLKQRVSNLSYGLREVMQLRPVSFVWKDQADGKVNLGLIAQEVEPVIPEVVVRGKDPALPLGMNYASLVPVVVKAIQEQHTIIMAVEAENTTLNARLQAIEQAMQEMTKQMKEQREQGQPENSRSRTSRQH